MIKTTYDPTLEQVIEVITSQIKYQMERRTYLAANELRNAANLVLRGQRSGRRYKVPGTYRRQRDKVDGKMKNGRYYTASAPGEPPANRLGHFRMSWQPNARIEDGLYTSMIESDLKVGTGNQYLLGDILEEGTSKMAPRPYQELILNRAIAKIKRIYSEPYF
jgi:hypothetical protein